MKNKYAPFFAAYNKSVQMGNPYTKEEVLKDFTNGIKTSLKDLSIWELQELTRRLTSLALPQQNNDKADKMRKAIIAIFKSMNRTVEDAKAWAEKQGVKGTKKPFNAYTTGELYVLIAVAEKIKYDWQKSIRKKVTQNFANHEQN